MTRRSFIARAAAWSASVVAGVRLAIEGSVVDLGSTEAFAEVKPAVETSGMRINPETLHFEFQSEHGWEDLGHALVKAEAIDYEEVQDPVHEHNLLAYRKSIQNDSLTRCFVKAARPKKEAVQ